MLKQEENKVSIVDIENAFAILGAMFRNMGLSKEDAIYYI